MPNIEYFKWIYNSVREQIVKVKDACCVQNNAGIHLQCSPDKKRA